MLKNNLISLLDMIFPEANRLFFSPSRADGSEKWVDFVAEFWHCECVSSLSQKAFTTKYQKWCKKHGYYFSQDKALDIYTAASGQVGVMPKTDTTKLLVGQAVSQLRATAAALAALRQEMRGGIWTGSSAERITIYGDPAPDCWFSPSGAAVFHRPET